MFVVADDLVGLRRELRLVDHDEPDTLLRQDLLLPLVVELALLTTGHPGDGRAPVEKRDGHGVLLLLELDHEPQRRPIPVDREPASPSGRRGHVTDKPQERRLSLPADPDYLVAEVENVVLITVGALAPDAYRYSMTATTRMTPLNSSPPATVDRATMRCSGRAASSCASASLIEPRMEVVDAHLHDLLGAGQPLSHVRPFGALGRVLATIRRTSDTCLPGIVSGEVCGYAALGRPDVAGLGQTVGQCRVAYEDSDPCGRGVP